MSDSTVETPALPSPFTRSENAAVLLSPSVTSRRRTAKLITVALGPNSDARDALTVLRIVQELTAILAKRADELQARLSRRLAELDREAQISATPPVALGGLIVGSPKKVLVDLMKGIIASIKGAPYNKAMHEEMHVHINGLH